MIGGVNTNSSLAYQAGNNAPARERSDIARAPASSAEGNPSQVRRDLADGALPSTETRPITPPEALERRVEARRAAEDARFERFRADDIPLATSQALATFASVAASSSNTSFAPDSLITGIDVRI
jgi:hypothetical protein